MDLGFKDYICNSFRSFDSIKPLNESIRVANRSSMRIIGQGSVKLLCKQPNRVFPFQLQLDDVYFIPKCTVNLVSTSQLSRDRIAFDFEVPCLKAFSLIEALCSISQINCYYVLNTTLKLETAFIESIDPIYLILSPLEHSLLLWHCRLGHASLRKIHQAIKTTQGIDLNILTIKKLPFCKACALSKL